MDSLSSYGRSGVDYLSLDAGKRSAATAAAETSQVMLGRGAEPLEATRGESAFAWQLGGQRYALVLECLGTKTTLACDAFDQLGVDRFDAIGYDTVMTATNDLVATGALPLVVNAYFAIGHSLLRTSPTTAASCGAGLKRAQTPEQRGVAVRVQHWRASSVLGKSTWPPQL